jgi:glycogen debranching enzyme
MHTYPISEDTCEEVEIEDENRDEEIADFAVELSYKIYVNKSIRRRKDLPDTTRDRLLDLSDLEEPIHREVDLCKKEHDSTLDIIRCTTFIGIARKKSIYKAHDLEDFSLQQGQVLERLLNSAKEQYSHNKVTVTALN